MKKAMKLPPMIATGAELDYKRLYRYRLWRIWDTQKPLMLWIMLNPSTADEQKNDMTIKLCIRRAEMLGYGGIKVCNLFAWRSTDPLELDNAPDPIGHKNDVKILDEAHVAHRIVCAWGTDGVLMQRGKQVVELLREAGLIKKVYVLGINKEDGSPKHPLRISYATPLTHWDGTRCLGTSL